MAIPPASPHLLEALTRMAALTALAGWGMVVAWRRDRLGRVWAGQALGALLIWLAYYPLSLLQQAKERDDTYYWLRIHIAVLAAIGVWDLARRVLPRVWPAALPAGRRAALVAALALPFALPSWWNPSRMDLYFAGSLEPLPSMLTESAAVLRAEGPSRVTLAGDPAAARWMAALAGARVTLGRQPLQAARLRQSDSPQRRARARRTGGSGFRRLPLGCDASRGDSRVPGRLRCRPRRPGVAALSASALPRPGAGRRLPGPVRRGAAAFVILAPGELLGLRGGMAAILDHAAAWHDVLFALAVAIGVCEARGRRRAALALAITFAVLGTGFWVVVLARPYGVLADPVATRWAADVSVAGWSGGDDGFVVGERPAARNWAAASRRLGPQTVLLVPTVLPVLVVPASALAIALLWRRPDASLAAILWAVGATGDLDTVRGLGFVPGLWARPVSSLLWVLILAAVLVIVRLRVPPVVATVAGAIAVLSWTLLGRRAPDMDPPSALLAVTLDQGLWLVAGAAGLWRGRDRGAIALVAGGALLVLAPSLGGPGDPWAGQAFLRAGLVLASATCLQSVAGDLVSEWIRRAATRWRLEPECVPIAVVVTVLAAGGVPAWWDPVRIDPVFKASIEPVPEALVGAMDWIRENTPRDATIVADEDYAPAVAILGGRRILRAPSLVSPPDDERRLRLERGIFEGHPPPALLQRYGVRYVFLGPGQFRQYGVGQPEDMESGGAARLAYANEKGMRLYEVGAAPGPSGSFK